MDSGGFKHTKFQTMKEQTKNSKTDNTPIRVQRKRTKGVKLPANTICVDRSTKWGNPFMVKRDGLDWIVKDQDGNYWGRVYRHKNDAASKAVECYRGWVVGQIGLKKLNIEELRGKNLACFCSLSSPCHADYLLELMK